MKQKVSRLLVVAMLLTIILPFQSISAASSTPDQIVKVAKEYIGVPYKWGGTTPSGFDCSGYMRYVYDQVGISLPRTAADQYNAGTKVSKSELKPGDLVFFHKTYNKKGITHAGIYIGNNQFISATSSKGIKVDSLSSSYWGPKYYGATRVIDKAPGEFYDLNSNHVAYDAISTLTKLNIIYGYEDGTFKPDANLTRGQAAAIINRQLKKNPSKLDHFSDVPTNSRFAKDIAAIKELGIIQGFGDGTFRPNNTMTRAEMALIVQKAFELEHAQIASTRNKGYNDIEPGYWAHDAIVTMSHIDTTTLFDGDQYYPAKNASRAVFTTAIYNAMNATK
jgi:hypothetical protein